MSPEPRPRNPGFHPALLEYISLRYCSLSLAAAPVAVSANAWLILEWIVWGLAALLALSWLWGCRGYAAQGGLNVLTAAQCMLLAAVPIVFVLTGWNKFHIIWAAPVAVLCVYVLVIIPGVNIVLALLTNVFARVVLGAGPRGILRQATASHGAMAVPPRDHESPNQEELDHELEHSAAMADARAAARWLALGANPNAHISGESALRRAILNDDLAMVQLLVKHGADVNAESTAGSGPLHAAAVTGSVEITDLLISLGAVVDRVNVNGITPLACAVLNLSEYDVYGPRGHMQVAESLIRAGSDVNFRSQYGGRTPLHLAAAQRDVHMVQLLLAGGAVVDVLDHENKTPLLIAEEAGNIAVAHLLRRGAH